MPLFFFAYHITPPHSHSHHRAIKASPAASIIRISPRFFSTLIHPDLAAHAPHVLSIHPPLAQTLMLRPRVRSPAPPLEVVRYLYYRIAWMVFSPPPSSPYRLRVSPTPPFRSFTIYVHPSSSASSIIHSSTSDIFVACCYLLRTPFLLIT